MEVLPIYALPFRTAFLMFLLFSFVGWCSEVVYVGVLSAHKFVNRGFLHGPICPIYGFGGIVILLLPPVLYATWLPLFFASLVLCSGIEYFGSWILEKMFHTLWWDYSHYKFNIKGRVCLLNSFLFGLMGMLSVHFVFPYVMWLLNWLGEFRCKIIAEVAAILLSTDIIITVKRLVDFNATMARIKMFGETLRDRFEHEEWFRGESITEMMASVKEHADIKKDAATQKLLERIERFQAMNHRNVESFMKRFPTMKSDHYRLEFEAIRQKIKARIKK